MKIKKMYQGTVPENKILDSYNTSQTDAYSCNYLNKKTDGKVLYENAQGTTQTVILNETFENFRYIEIIIAFGSITGQQNVVRVYNTDSSVNFENAFHLHDNNMNIYYRKYNITGTSITNIESYMWSSSGYVGVYNSHYILKVIGYK